MQLMQAWQDSLKILLPKNLKLFSLVTLKAIVECYKVLLRYWWWLIVLFGAIIIFKEWLWYGVINRSLFVLTYFSKKFLGVHIISWLDMALNILSQLFIFIVCLATRPSVTKKDVNYFKSYLPYFCYVLILLLPMGLTFFFRHWLLSKLFNSLVVFDVYWFITLFWLTAASPVYIFFLLFFLDSNKRPKQFFLSFYRSFKMVIYNYPLCWLLVMGFYCIGYIIYYGMGLQMPSMAMQQSQAVVWSREVEIILKSAIWFLKVVLAPIPICIFANIYIKKLHEQFDLYFTQPSQEEQ